MWAKLTASTSRDGMKALPVASMLGLIVFTTVWGFASSAILTVQPHSLRNHLMEMGRPIQAVAIPASISPEPLTGKSVVSGETGAHRDPARSAIGAIAGPVAAVVGQLTDPLSIKPASDPAPSVSKGTPSRKGYAIQASIKRNDREGTKAWAKSGKEGSGKERSDLAEARKQAKKERRA